MPKLTYWKCACLDDADCYSIRERTRRDAKARREEEGAENARRFSQPFKVVIEYTDAFDLIEHALTEGGAEPPTPDEALKGTKNEWMLTHRVEPA